jgi:predicted YcjX-like family ATPase|tara:strand:- start:10 stop:315 length:306 start_codon:yes stop_codon:yes gene_type:complete
MAKRKTPKAEKVIDLAPKAENVTEEQLKKIQSIVDRINRTQMDIGNLETRKHQALHFIAGVNDELNLIQNELNEQYGTFDIDIQTGVINYPQENGETDKED